MVKIKKAAHLIGKKIKFGPLATATHNKFKAQVNSGWQKYKILKYWLGINAGITGEALYLGNEKHMQEWTTKIQELKKTEPSKAKALDGFLKIRDSIITFLYPITPSGVKSLKFGGDNESADTELDATNAIFYKAKDRRGTPLNPYIRICSKYYNNQESWNAIQNAIKQTENTMIEVTVKDRLLEDYYNKKTRNIGYVFEGKETAPERNIKISKKEAEEVSGISQSAESLIEYFDRLAYLSSRKRTIKW